MLYKMAQIRHFLHKSALFCKLFERFTFFILFLRRKRVFALVLKAKYRQFPNARTRRTLTQVCRFAAYLGLSEPAFQPVLGRMAKGNSPFGAWVVCVYRLEAVESPAWINATICAFFVFIQNMVKFFVERG